MAVEQAFEPLQRLLHCLAQLGLNATESNRHPGLVPGSTGRQAREKEFLLLR
jgi:hypothetical protein